MSDKSMPLMSIDDIRKMERTMEEHGIDIDTIIAIVETALKERENISTSSSVG